jgi:hypothetical protein
MKLIASIGWIIAVLLIHLPLGLLAIKRAHPSNRRIVKIAIVIIVGGLIIIYLTQYFFPSFWGIKTYKA